VVYAISSAALIGTTPIFGKMAILAGLSPLAVVATRTLWAAIMLAVVVGLLGRRYFYIYPLGLLGCALAGGLNGAGSLFYYLALGRIDAGIGQLLYSTYPLFVALILFLDGQRHGTVTLLALALSLPALVLLTRFPHQPLDPTGAAFMLLAGLLYALHIPINQRVLYEVPAPTVTLYTMLAMAGVVLPAYLLSKPTPAPPREAWLGPLLALTVVTFLSRLTLFSGVKAIGGLQTAILGLGQLLVTLALARVWLGESLALAQWIGAGLLALALGLTAAEREAPQRSPAHGWLAWLRPALIPPARVPKGQSTQARGQRPAQMGPQQVPADLQPPSECSE
jgi:drug/metabolite transporter (DMT)-like permease